MYIFKCVINTAISLGECADTQRARAGVPTRFKLLLAIMTKDVGAE
jgi:hypothetical protein